MRIPYRKTYEVIGYTYEADLHCLDCSEERFGSEVHSLDFSAIDNEGNPIHPIFLGDLGEFESTAYCSDCFGPLE